MPKRYPLKQWRAFYDVAACWTVIGLAIGSVVHFSNWLYPWAAILISNRVLALSLLCHEAIHGNLHPNRFVNDWIGRYLCGFPALVSLSKYRRLHLLHHSAVGSKKWDPDIHLYDFYPTSARRYALKQIVDLFSLRTFGSFLSYYTDLPDCLNKNKQWHKDHDFGRFMIFHLLLFGLLISLEFSFEYFVFWILPILMITQPYVLLMGGLQHGPVGDRPNDTSRTIIGAKWYMWLLLPCDINFHGEHHCRPSIPHYYLHDFSIECAQDGVALWKTSYQGALRDLFTRGQQ